MLADDLNQGLMECSSGSSHRLEIDQPYERLKHRQPFVRVIRQVSEFRNNPTSTLRNITV